MPRARHELRARATGALPTAIMRAARAILTAAFGFEATPPFRRLLLDAHYDAAMPPLMPGQRHNAGANTPLREPTLMISTTTLLAADSYALRRRRLIMPLL